MIPATRVAEFALALSVPMMCPDCPYSAPLVEMAEHYKLTGHGRRTKP